MVDQALVENITNRFQSGEKTAEVRDALINEGWSNGDIDAAFAHIRHTALLQIPIYAKLHAWITNVDQKTAQLPTRTMVLIFTAIGLLFIGSVVATYLILDPLGFQTSQRDITREDNAVALRESLAAYNKTNHVYPASLEKLVPKFLKSIPVDPKTKKPYKYKALANNSHYEFCVDFEMQTVRCISSVDTSEIPTAEQVVEPNTTAPLITGFQINGQIYIDTNGNKIKDSDEDTQASVPIKIQDDSQKSVNCEILADSSGIFNCTLPGAGTYTVSLTLPRGTTSVLGNPISVTLPNPNNSQPTIETLFIGLVK